MAQESIQIADKPTLDRIEEMVGKIMNVFELAFDSDEIARITVPFEQSTIPYNFNNGSAVVLDGEIHILGSKNDGCMMSHYKWDGFSWTEVSTLPYNFYSGSVIILNEEIHILGGIGGATKHYKWDGSSWTEVSTLPYRFLYGSAVVLDGEIHIFGGTYDSTNHYAWNGSSWIEIPALSYNFNYGSAVVLDEEIHILGGSKSMQSHYIITEEHGKKMSLWLPKGIKIRSIYQIDSIHNVDNCVKDEDHLVVTENGVVEFLIDTEATSAKLTLLY